MKGYKKIARRAYRNAQPHNNTKVKSGGKQSRAE